MRGQHQQGHAVLDALSNFRKGWDFGQGIQDKKREDARTAELRKREDEAYQYKMDTRQSADEVVEQRNADRAYKEGQQQHEIDSRATPEQMQEGHRLTLAGKRESLAGQKQRNAQSKTNFDNKQSDREDKKTANQLLASMDVMASPLGQQFNDAKFLEQSRRFGPAFAKGESLDSVGVDAPELYDYANKLFVNELSNGVGDKLPNGGVITGKRIVAARRVGNFYRLELDVSYKDKDGSIKSYRAPVTKGRTIEGATSEATDEVMPIPMEAIADKLKGAEFISRVVQESGIENVDNLSAELRRQYVGLTGNSKDLPGQKKEPVQHDPLKVAGVATGLMHASRKQDGDPIPFDDAVSKVTTAGQKNGLNAAQQPMKHAPIPVARHSKSTLADVANPGSQPAAPQAKAEQEPANESGKKAMRIEDLPPDRRAHAERIKQAVKDGVMPRDEAKRLLAELLASSSKQG